ncbi:MAG: type II secretion system minor pseudopilin GspJ [Desulfobulbaceae bacterium]|nr:type II secretion system minor pseudopilin GspJ [Desulfobulbaceae bacterium]
MTVRRNTGFTLIEVLVAMAIFGVMSMLAYMTLGQTLANSEMLTERMDRLRAIQQTVRFLSSDFVQAAPRPVRLELGDSMGPAVFTSLSGEFALELTHGGWGNPAGLPRGTLQRTAYRLEKDELVRYHWNVLDRTYANQPIANVLLDGVESLLFRYLAADGEWSEVWPPLAQPDIRARPRAVEIVLTLADEGEIRRLLEVAP